MIIRAAQKKDLAICEKIGRIPEFKLPSGEYHDSRLLKRWLDDDFFLVAEEKGEVLGYLIAEDMLKSKTVMLWFVAVEKNNRDRGIGKKLVKTFEKNCRKRKMEWIVLYSPMINKKNIKFYKSLGYEKGKSFFEFNKEL